MFLGFYQLGALLPLRVRTMTSARVPTKPDAAPQARIIGEDGTVLQTVSLPMFDQQRTTGYFHHRVSLTANYTEQRYTVIYTWLISDVLMSSSEEFEIIPGGAISGATIAMHYFRQESADFVLLQDDSGVLNKLRGPEVRNAR